MSGHIHLNQTGELVKHEKAMVKLYSNGVAFRLSSDASCRQR